MRLPISLLGCSVMPGMPQRRFPPPWSVEETDACFIVRDKNGQALAYVYFEEEPGRSARRHTRMTTTTLGTPNQLPSWGHLLG